MAIRKSPTLSVGETARRLSVSADTIRNYCKKGFLRCVRTKGKHRRILLSSIQAFETQRTREQATPEPERVRPNLPEIDEEFEIYYLGNPSYSNDLDLGFICNVSHIEQIGHWNGPSGLVQFVGQFFGGGTYKVRRVRDGNVVSERVIELPGPTKDDQVSIFRESALDSPLS